MIGLLVLGFPFLLLGFMLFMQKFEEPLSRVAVERKVERFLDQADAEDMETFVREGTDSALRRFADRRFRRRRPNGRRRDVRRQPTDAQPTDAQPSDAVPPDGGSPG